MGLRQLASNNCKLTEQRQPKITGVSEHLPSSRGRRNRMDMQRLAVKPVRRSASACVVSVQ